MVLGHCTLVWYVACCTSRPASVQVHHEGLPGPSRLFSIHVPLADLEIQQVDPVAKLDICTYLFWFCQVSCPSDGIGFADFATGCPLSLLCLLALGCSLVGAAVERGRLFLEWVTVVYQLEIAFVLYSTVYRRFCVTL